MRPFIKTLLLMLFMAFPALAQTIQITAGPAIAATATSAPWIAGTTVCAGYQQTQTSSTISTSLLGGLPVPQSVLQNTLYSPMTCTITGLVPNNPYGLTYVGAETYWTNPGIRTFGLNANGNVLFTNLDLFTAAGGANIAIQKNYTVTASAAGTLVLTFTKGSDQPLFDALILTPANPLAATYTVGADGTKTVIIPPGAAAAMKTCYVGLAGSTYVMFAPQVP